MVDENNENEMDETENDESVEGLDDDVPEYEKMVSFEAEREVKLDNYTPPSKTIDEEEEVSEHLSDKQAALKILYPKYKDPELNEIAKSVTTSRVFPDNFMDKLFLLVASLMEKRIYDKDFNPAFIISSIQDILSRAFEGRGIADTLDLMNADSTDEMDKLAKSLNL